MKKNECKPLSADVRKLVRSGISITSVAQCVEELVLNSVDAEASNVFVRIDLDLFNVEVEDDGNGLSKDELGVVGIRHSTSKCHSITDLINPKYYGFRGEFIASIIDTSESVEIVSKSKFDTSDNCTYKQCFKNGDVCGREKATELRRFPVGTLVKVQNVLARFPVRQKRIDKCLQLERTKKSLELTCLINPRLSVILLNANTETEILNVRARITLIDTFSDLFCTKNGLETNSQNLIEQHHQFGSLYFNACLSTNTHSSNQLQLVYVNKRFISRCKVHRTLQSLILQALDIGTHSKDKDCGKDTNTKKKSGFDTRSPRSDKHTVFVVNITCPYNKFDIAFSSHKTQIEFHEWNDVLKGCEGLVLRFKATLQSLKRATHNSVFASHKNEHHPCNTLNTTENTDTFDIGKVISTHDLSRAVHSRVAVRNTEGLTSNVDSIRCSKSLQAMERSSSKYSEHSSGKGDSVNEEIRGSPKSKLKLVNRKSKTLDIRALKRRSGRNLNLVVPGKRPCVGPSFQPSLTANIFKQFTPFKMFVEQNLNPKPLEKLHSVIDAENNQQSNNNNPSGLQEITTKRVNELGNSQDWATNLDGLSVNDKHELVHSNLSIHTYAEKLQQIPSMLTPISSSIQKVQAWKPNNSDKELGSISEGTNRESSALVFEIVNKTLQSAVELQLDKPDSGVAIREECKIIIEKSHISGKNIWENLQRQGSSKNCTYVSQSPQPEEYLKNDIVKRGSSISSVSESYRKTHNAPLILPTHLNSCKFHKGISAENGNNTKLECLDSPEKWDSWDCNIVSDKNGKEWLQTKDNKGSNIYIDFETGMCNNTIVSVIESRRISSTEAAKLNRQGRYNWLSHYFPQGSGMFWKPEKNINRIQPNGNLEGIGESNSLGPLLQQYKNYDFEQTDSTKWRDGNVQLRGDLSLGEVSSSRKGLLNREVRISEYWERPVDPVEIPVCSLALTEISIFGKKSDVGQTSFKFCKDDLSRVKVLAQVDKKFIVTKVCTTVDTNPTEMLVVFDQHAVHERIRLETLIQELHYEDFQGIKKIRSVEITPPIILPFTDTEVRIIENYKNDFVSIGLTMDCVSSTAIKILTAPKCFADKIANKALASRDDTVKELIHTLIQEQVRSIIITKGNVQTMPKTIFNILCSIACHGAIKFGDTLDNDVCERLLMQLKHCKMPFQCAHGRPVLVSLMDLQSAKRAAKDANESWSRDTKRFSEQCRYSTHFIQLDDQDKSDTSSYFLPNDKSQYFSSQIY